MSDTGRKLVIGTAGVAIMLLGLGAALLPDLEGVRPPLVIGWLLLAAGVLEAVAASARWAHRPSAAIAAAATLLAGLRLLLDESAGFFEVLNLVILWLLVRAGALGLSAFRSRDQLGAWVALAAGTDFLLAIALLAGLPIAIMVVGLFGPTGPIPATFSWVLAMSFVADGVLLIATAKLEEGSDRAPNRAG